MAPRNSPSTEVPASTPKSVGCNACSYDGIAYWAIGGKRSIDYPAQGNPHYVCWLCVSITMRPGVMWARECVYLGYDIIPSRLQRGKINCETNDGHCDCCDWGTLQNLVFELPRKGVAGHGCYAVQKILKLRILQRQDIGSTIYRPLIPWMNNCPRRVQHVYFRCHWKHSFMTAEAVFIVARFVGTNRYPEFESTKWSYCCCCCSQSYKRVEKKRSKRSNGNSNRPLNTAARKKRLLPRCGWLFRWVGLFRRQKKTRGLPTRAQAVYFRSTYLCHKRQSRDGGGRPAMKWTRLRRYYRERKGLLQFPRLGSTACSQSVGERLYAQNVWHPLPSRILCVFFQHCCLPVVFFPPLFSVGEYYSPLSTVSGFSCALYDGGQSAEKRWRVSQAKAPPIGAGKSSSIISRNKLSSGWMAGEGAEQQ